MKGFLHFIEFEGLDDGFDFFHFLRGFPVFHGLKTGPGLKRLPEPALLTVTAQIVPNPANPPRKTFLLRFQ
jgi:hypothetical protein